MTDDIGPNECRLLDALYDHTIPTGSIHGPTLAALLARGYVEVTWAGRVRLTQKALTELFEVVVA